MHITVISASTRDDSQSRRVADYLITRLKLLKAEASLVDLNEQRLPIFDASGSGEWQPMWQEISNTLEKSDGFIFVSPEWDGMFSVGLHNMFHYIDKEMADKPVLPVGVSVGKGGRYPLEQMRLMGYKNKRFVYVPENLYFAPVGELLVDGKLTDEHLAERTDYDLQVLIEYAKALEHVRKSGTIDYQKFPNGL